MGNQQLGIVRQRRIEKKYEIKPLGTEIWVIKNLELFDREELRRNK